MTNNKLFFFVIILAVCLTQMASDIYAPSLPSIAADLKTDMSWSKWSMAIYMLGVALSQLIYGPLSEGYGRKGPLLIGIGIMFLGTLLALFAETVDLLIWGRFVQGCGAGACAALWRPIFRDVYTGEELAQRGSYITLVVMFIIYPAPLLGGFLESNFGWRSSFLFMALYALLAFSAIFYGYQETSAHHHKERLKPAFIGKTFTYVMTHPLFAGVTIATFLSYGALFCWFVVGPVLLIHVIGISSVDFGLITFLGGGAAYGLGGWFNRRLVTRLGSANMMRIGWSLMTLAGVLLLLGKFLIGVTLIAIVPPVILFYFGSTIIWPNAFAIAFAPFGTVAGYAGALYGFMQVSGPAALGGLMSYLPSTDQLPLSIVMIASSLFACLIFELVAPKKNG